jgi:hypothetical protein
MSPPATMRAERTRDDERLRDFVAPLDATQDGAARRPYHAKHIRHQVFQSIRIQFQSGGEIKRLVFLLLLFVFLLGLGLVLHCHDFATQGIHVHLRDVFGSWRGDVE